MGGLIGLAGRKLTMLPTRGSWYDQEYGFGIWIKESMNAVCPGVIRRQWLTECWRRKDAMDGYRDIPIKRLAQPGDCRCGTFLV